MSEHLQEGLEAEARARLSAVATNPAENDFEGLCVQCCTRHAQTLTLFRGRNSVPCNAFCSFECAEMFAFELANNTCGIEGELPNRCPHDILDGEYCEDCREEYVTAAQAASKGGAA